MILELCLLLRPCTGEMTKQRQEKNKPRTSQGPEQDPRQPDVSLNRSFNFQILKRQQAATCCHIVIRTHNHCSLLYNFSFTTGSSPSDILASLWICWYILYMGMSSVWWMGFKWGRLLTTGPFGDKCRAPVNKFLSEIPLRHSSQKCPMKSRSAFSVFK